MKYIIFTCDIHPIGGMQLLTAGKAEVLESMGWEVFVFFPAHGMGRCALPYLDKYNNGGICELTLPPFKWSKHNITNTIDRMCSIIGTCAKNERIIIESHYDIASQWGEILASRIKAKHMLFLCNEIYRGKGKYYVEFLDYYDFKHKRRELAGEMDDILYKLFDGYKTVPNDETYIFKYDENPIRDIENDKISAIERLDWNICYIGRVEKQYVPNIVCDVIRFAKIHPDKKIQFIFVGDISARRKLIESSLKGVSNIKLLELGDVVPIPKSLFKKIDVVIAGSGSAKCAAYEGVFTIVADASNSLANGVLGYDTNDELYHSHVKQTSFDIVLESVLVERRYDQMASILPPYMGPRECVEQNFELIKNSCSTLEYYSVKELCGHEMVHIDATCMLFYDWACHYIPMLAKLLKLLKKRLS